LAQGTTVRCGATLYPTLEEKATALCFSLIKNHPFTDGNKRIGHAAMETLLILNGYELHAAVEEAERIILGVAAGEAGREELLLWVRAHVVPFQRPGAE
jgi:death-on-curing protein